MKRTLTILGLAVLAVLVLAACAPAAEPTPAQTQEPQPVPVVEARQPKRLEVTVTIGMGDIFFATADGVVGGPFVVPAGTVVGIHIVNNGAIEHEIMFGREVESHEGAPHGYMESLFEDIPVDVFVYPSGKKIEVEMEGGMEEVELEPGADIWLRVTFPEGAKGTWEIGCFVPGHYEAGMLAQFIVK